MINHKIFYYLPRYVVTEQYLGKMFYPKIYAGNFWFLYEDKQQNGQGEVLPESNKEKSVSQGINSNKKI